MLETKVEAGQIISPDLCWTSRETSSDTPKVRAFEYLDEKFQASIKRILFSDGEAPR